MSKLTAAEYKDPVLGLILLRFAENRFNETLKQIEKNIPTNPRTGKKEITKDHFIGSAAPNDVVEFHKIISKIFKI